MRYKVLCSIFVSCADCIINCLSSSIFVSCADCIINCLSSYKSVWRCHSSKQTTHLCDCTRTLSSTSRSTSTRWSWSFLLYGPANSAMVRPCLADRCHSRFECGVRGLHVSENDILNGIVRWVSIKNQALTTKCGCVFENLHLKKSQKWSSAQCVERIERNPTVQLWVLQLIFNRVRAVSLFTYGGISLYMSIAPFK